VTLPESTALELGHRSIQRFVAIVLPTLTAAKQVGFRQHFIDVLRIIRPVCRNMQRATCRQAICTELEERGLNDPTFVMAAGTRAAHAPQALR